MSEHPIMKQGNDPEEIPVPKEPQSVQDEYGSEVAQQHTSDAMISGALPVMWLILIALAVMKLVPLSPESPLPDALPGWLGLAASFAVLAGMTGLAGIPSARKAIAGTAAAVIGMAGVLTLAATGSPWILVLGFVVLVLPVSRLVYRWVMARPAGRHASRAPRD